MIRKLYSFAFVILLFNWLVILFSTSVQNIPYLAPFGLLTILPINFVIALFALVLLTFFSAYRQDYYFSILFAVMFSVYFCLTSFMIEPLAINDSIYHYSGVAVINNLGRIPSLERYYLDFPGSYIVGSLLVSTTGLNYVAFLKYVFPAFSLFVFLLGLSAFIYKFQGLKYVSLALLFSSIFGWGANLFSPQAVGRMLLPLVLLLLITPRKVPRILAFVLLVTGLVISHPTTSVFLGLILIGYIVILEILFHFSRQPDTSIKHIVVGVLILVVSFLLWSMSVSVTINIHFSAALRTLAIRIFSPSQIQQALIQSPYPVAGISEANYAYVGLACVLSGAILLKSAIEVVKARKTHLNTEFLQKLLGPVMILMGLVSAPLLFISGYGQYGLSSGAAYAFFGASISLVFLNLGSKKTFCALLVIALLLVFPAFIYNHAYDAYNLNGKQIQNGMIFVGKYDHNPSLRIITPFGNQLWAFLDYNLWDQVISIYPFWGTTSEPVVYTGQRGDYFIYRIDGAVYTSLQSDGGVPLNETSYSQIYRGLLNSNDFDVVYCSGDYEVAFSPP